MASQRTPPPTLALSSLGHAPITVPAMPEPPKPPDCAAIKRCVHKKIPRRSVRPQGGDRERVRFNPEDPNTRMNSLSDCFGATLSERWEARECGPIEIGRDVRNGVPVEAHVECGDICPNYTHVRTRYVDVLASECACLGGGFSREWLNSYTGCSPYPPRYAKRSSGKLPAFVPDLLTFFPTELVLQIDGVAVDPGEADERIAAMPGALPRSMLVSGSGYLKHVRFVGKRDIERLWNAMGGSDLFLDPPMYVGATCSAERKASWDDPAAVSIENRFHQYFTECPDERTARLRRLSKTIQQLFERPVDSSKRPSPYSIPCSILHRRPIVFSTTSNEGPSEMLEVRFLDWMRPKKPVLTRL